MPSTTPWMPGSLSPSSEWRTSVSGTSTDAPITGPQAEPTPPNSVMIKACAEVSIPNTDCGVTTSSTTA